MQTEQSMPNLRRWCRECGLPSSIGEPSCVHCGEVPNQATHLSSILNEGNGSVQNTVLNIDTEGLLEALNDGEVKPVPVSQGSFFHRFFMFTCAIAMWCGIVTVITVVVALITLVVFAMMKAHG